MNETLLATAERTGHADGTGAVCLMAVICDSRVRGSPYRGDHSQMIRHRPDMVQKALRGEKIEPPDVAR